MFVVICACIAIGCFGSISHPYAQSNHSIGSSTISPISTTQFFDTQCHNITSCDECTLNTNCSWIEHHKDSNNTLQCIHISQCADDDIECCTSLSCCNCLSQRDCIRCGSQGLNSSCLWDHTNSKCFTPNHDCSGKVHTEVSMHI